MNESVNGLIEVAKWIDFFILSGVTLAAIVIVLRLLKKTEFKIGQLKLRLAHFPFVILGLSILHLFLAWMITQKVHALESQSTSTQKMAWDKLTNSEAFIFNNMKKRRVSSDGGPFGSKGHLADALDTAFWASLGFAMSIMVTTVVALGSRSPNEQQSYYSRFSALAMGCALAGGNWLIGSWWAIAVSRLAP